MEKRQRYIEKIAHCYTVNPAVALLGSRQAGKTTLAKLYAAQFYQPEQVHWFDCEDPTDLSALESPKVVLENLDGLIVIDEVQKRPNLFPLLRVLIDQHREGHFYCWEVPQRI